MAWEDLKNKADRLAGNNDEASLALYKNAYSEATSNHEKVYSLGGIAQTLINLNRDIDAKEYLNKILQINPNNSWAKKRVNNISRAPGGSASKRELEKLASEEKSDSIEKEKIVKAADDREAKSIDRQKVLAKNIPGTLSNVEIDLPEGITDEDVMLFANSIDLDLSTVYSVPATEATEEYATENAGGSKSDEDYSLVGELTGISGVIRIKDALWEWLKGNDSASYKGAFGKIELFDIFDLMYWIGAIIAVFSATAGGASIGGIGAVVAGGIGALSSIIARVAAKRIAVGAAIKILFKLGRNAFMRSWRLVIKRTLMKNGSSLGLMRSVRAAGLSKKEARVIAEIVKKEGRKYSDTVFKNKIAREGFTEMSKAALVRTVKEMPALTKIKAMRHYKIPMNKLNDVIRTSIKNQWKYMKANTISKILIKAGVDVTRLSFKIITSPVKFADWLIETQFKHGKSFNTGITILNYLGIGLVFTDEIVDSIVDSIGADVDSTLHGENEDKGILLTIQDAFKEIESFKLALGSSLWQIRQDLEKATGI